MRALLCCPLTCFHRIASAKAGPTTQAFVEKIFQQMGIMVFGLAAYENKDGHMRTF